MPNIPRFGKRSDPTVMVVRNSTWKRRLTGETCPAGGAQLVSREG
jgi:hypothetical protein